MDSLLLKNGLLVTMNANNEIKSNMDVYLEGGKKIHLNINHKNPKSETGVSLFLKK